MASCICAWALERARLMSPLPCCPQESNFFKTQLNMLLDIYAGECNISVSVVQDACRTAVCSQHLSEAPKHCQWRWPWPLCLSDCIARYQEGAQPSSAARHADRVWGRLCMAGSLWQALYGRLCMAGSLWQALYGRPVL